MGPVGPGARREVMYGAAVRSGEGLSRGPVLHGSEDRTPPACRSIANPASVPISRNVWNGGSPLGTAERQCAAVACMKSRATAWRNDDDRPESRPVVEGGVRVRRGYRKAGMTSSMNSWRDFLFSACG